MFLLSVLSFLLSFQLVCATDLSGNWLQGLFASFFFMNQQQTTFQPLSASFANDVALRLRSDVGQVASIDELTSLLALSSQSIEECRDSFVLSFQNSFHFVLSSSTTSPQSVPDMMLYTDEFVRGAATQYFDSTLVLSVYIFF